MQLDYFDRRLDDKNRLTIPSEIRKEFESGIIITRGHGEYLHIYSKDVWDQKMEPALKGDILSEEVADLNVKFRVGKMGAQLDQKQGRVTIDKKLLEYAKIEKSVMAVRVGEYWRLMREDMV